MKVQFDQMFHLLASLLVVPHAVATNCFYCMTPDHQYNATVRRQLATQTDIFFYPIGVRSQYCSESIDPDNTFSTEAQICSKYSMCVTLFPNLPNSTFVVRGCLENILRHSFREDEQLHSDGCYLIRSLPMFPKTVAMDYVVCTCHGDYCNSIAMPSKVERPYSFGKSSVLKLTSSDGGRSLQIATSSSATVSFITSILVPLLYKTFQFIRSV